MTGRVTRTGESGAQVELSNGIEAYIRPQEFADGMDGRPEALEAGQEITAKVIRVESRERKVELSIRRFDRDEERRMLKQYVNNTQGPMTLGDVLQQAQAENKGE